MRPTKSNFNPHPPQTQNYNRALLVSEAAAWLTTWNYHAWRQQINDPHQSDFLTPQQIELCRMHRARQNIPGDPPHYAKRSQATAADAVSNIIWRWRSGMDSQSEDVWRMRRYIDGLPKVGFNRLANEIIRRAGPECADLIDDYNDRMKLLPTLSVDELSARYAALEEAGLHDHAHGCQVEIEKRNGVSR